MESQVLWRTAPQRLLTAAHSGTPEKSQGVTFAVTLEALSDDIAT